MSINIQLEGGLKKLSGQTMSKEKIIDKLGYTPADAQIVEANIAKIEADLAEHVDNAPDIFDDESGSLEIADPSGNVIAKVDEDGLHTTNVEAESLTSNDNDLLIADDSGNVIFKVDENGAHTTKLELTSGDLDSQLNTINAAIEGHISKLDGEDGTPVHILPEERERWDNKSDFSGNYNDLDNKPNIIDDGSNNLTIADTDGNIVFKVDADGTHTTALEIDGKDIIELINSNGFSGDYNDLKNKPNIIEDGSGKLEFADEAGNVVARIDEDGFETTKITTKSLVVNGAAIEELAQIEVDTELSDVSENPVQNKVVTEEIEYTKTITDNRFSLLDLCAREEADGTITLFLQPCPAGLYKADSHFSTLEASWSQLLADGKLILENGELSSCCPNSYKDAEYFDGDLLLPESNIIKIIAKSAFEDSKLTSINIPDGVITISDGAFYSSSLKKIKLPKTLSTIGSEAFRGTGELQIDLDKNNPHFIYLDKCLIDTYNKTIIKGSLFGSIPTDGSVTSIREYAFACLNPSIFDNTCTLPTIPEGITTLADAAFAGNGLTDSEVLIIPDSVVSIGSDCFSLTYLKEISFSENSKLTSIGAYAFYATGLNSINIPKTVTSIGSMAFSGLGLDDDSIVSGCDFIIVPESVVSIGNSAFKYCENLYYRGTEEDWTSKFGAGTTFGAKNIHYNYTD